MSSRFTRYLLQFFPARSSRQLRKLYLELAIGDLAVAAVMLFEPVYLFSLGYSISQILFFFLAIYVLYFILMPLGAAGALRYGYAKMIFVSSLFSVAYYFSLLGVAWSVFFLPLAILMYTSQKTCYWPSYYYDLSRYGQDEEEGREVSAVAVIELVVGALGPFLGGLVLFFGSYSMLFVVASVLIVASTLPLLIDAEPVTPQPFPYGDAYRRLVNPEKRRLVVSIMGYGEELIALVLWPIFMYVIVSNNLLSLGSLVGLTTLATAIIVLYVGRLSDQTNKESVLRISTIFYAGVWGLRLFFQSVGGVFIVDALARVAKRTLMVPQMSMIYERARHRQHAMATAILYEMSLVVGKIMALLITATLFLLAPLDVAWAGSFLVAAAFTFLYLLL